MSETGTGARSGPPTRPPSRRRFLSLIGLAGASALAGCSADSADETDTESGGTDEPSGVGGNDGTGGAAIDCGAFDGAPTAFDPGDEPWIFTFDYPDTWEPRDPSFDDDSEGSVSADVGHVGTATDDEYGANIRVDQVTVPRDREFIDEWIESGNFEIERTLEYEGEPQDVAAGHVTPEDVVYRVALPTPDGATATYHQVSMRAWMLEEYLGCSDAVFDVAWQVFESIRPARG